MFIFWYITLSYFVFITLDCVMLYYSILFYNVLSFIFDILMCNTLYYTYSIALSPAIVPKTTHHQWSLYYLIFYRILHYIIHVARCSHHQKSQKQLTTKGPNNHSPLKAWKALTMAAKTTHQQRPINHSPTKTAQPLTAKGPKTTHHQSPRKPIAKLIIKHVTKKRIKLHKKLKNFHNRFNISCCFTIMFLFICLILMFLFSFWCFGDESFQGWFAQLLHLYLHRYIHLHTFKTYGAQSALGLWWTECAHKVRFCSCNLFISTLFLHSIFIKSLI